MTHRLATTAGAIAAALTLSASVANAAAPTGSTSRLVGALAGNHGTGDCSDVYGRWWADAALAAHTAPSAQAAEADETETEDESPSGERPQNHGWFVSQAAHDKTSTGADHGKAVSEVARGNAGKPSAAEH
jgi:hypothetical protein